jgi:hypothetical protein
MNGIVCIEAMAELFADIVTEGKVHIGFSIWYSTTNERAQRDMPRAAVEATYRPVDQNPPNMAISYGCSISLTN